MKHLVLFVLLCVRCFCGFAQIPNDVPAFQSSVLQPKGVVEMGQGHYFFDFGKDAFGTLSVLLLTAQTDSLVVHVGEKLNGPNTIDRKPGGTIRYKRLVVRNPPVGTLFPVIFPPEVRNTHPPAIPLPDSFGSVMPYRYVEIENLKIPISDVIVRQKVFNYRFADGASAFACSDTVLNQVWEMCKHTIKATSFAGLYIDGDRERIPYEADAYINQLSHYAVDSEYTLARRTNDYFITHPTWPVEWILHTVLLFYNDYLYTGDTTALAKHYEALKHKTLVALERKDGLLDTDSNIVTSGLMRNIGFAAGSGKIKPIFDWPLNERDGYDMVRVNTVVNAFHYINLKRMATIASVLHKQQDAAFFSRQSLLVKNAINRVLLNKATGIYNDGEGSAHSSLHANLFPLAFGIVPKEYLNNVLAFVKSRGMACSVYGAQYLLEGLYQHGESDYALQLMNSTNGDRNWWNMLRQGSTMAWEAWDIRYKPNQDWNHAWGTAPANIIARYLWGIAPAKPGFTEVTIQPQLSTLTWSNIKVPTIRGAIVATYKQVSSQHKAFTIELPKDVKGTFMVPMQRRGRVLVNGRLVKLQKPYVMLRAGKTQIVIIE